MTRAIEEIIQWNIPAARLQLSIGITLFYSNIARIIFLYQTLVVKAIPQICLTSQLGFAGWHILKVYKFKIPLKHPQNKFGPVLVRWVKMVAIYILWAYKGRKECYYIPSELLYKFENLFAICMIFSPLQWRLDHE